MATLTDAFLADLDALSDGEDEPRNDDPPVKDEDKNVRGP
jgi:hypothetical protein